MKQMGWKVGGSTAIDNLEYHYVPNSNKLLAVKEITLGTTDNKLGDFTDKNTTLDDYDYDDNGNLKFDKNKGIASINYNHLNLPSVVTVNGKGTISYTYDAVGNKLKKVVHETNVSTPHGSQNVTITTLYIGGFVYESRQYSQIYSGQTNYTNKLQYIAHEEGRIRPTDDPNKPFVYDYYLKDHLGNVRMTLTEEEKVDAYPLLTFEGASGSPEINNQDAYWENKNAQSINVAGVRSQVTFGSSQTNAMLVRQSSSNGTVGATKFLKVMAGDRIHTKVDYYYNQAGNTNNSNTTTANNIISSIINSITNTGKATNLIKGNEATIQTELNNNFNFSSFVNPAPNANPNNGQQLPKAYLCVLFFNEQFQFDQASSRIYPVQYLSNGSYGTIDKTFSNAIEAKKNGYAFVYFTNESNELVYFDNFHLSHERGRIVEETHYYPFGLSIAAISSSALDFAISNRTGFNNGEEQNCEFADGSGLEWLDFNARMYDPQLGRFFNIDPLAEYARRWSPYVFSFNNPLRFADPSGMMGGDSIMVDGKLVPKEEFFLNPDGTVKETTMETVVVEGKKKSSGGGWFHGFMDVLGTIDPTGAVDLIHAITYAAEGNWKDAGLTAAGIVPFAGDSFKALKYTDEAGELVEGVVKYADETEEVVETSVKQVDEGIIYLRKDKNGNVDDYVGQAKSEERYAARQKEHARANPDSDFEFQIIDRGKAGKDLNQKEQKHIDSRGGPKNKSNPNGKLSNKKNVIRKVPMYY